MALHLLKATCTGYKWLRCLYKLINIKKRKQQISSATSSLLVVSNIEVGDDSHLSRISNGSHLGRTHLVARFMTI